ncbi:hypothetical protein OJ998_10140 [Solirubrobacter taibaiensis]|nr:hypothetical protein [Solirubrobacter taibaiensis]
MDIAERARELLGRPGPDSSKLLWQLARDAAANGMTQDQLEAVFLELRDGVREEEEDRLFDILDCIVGWCRPEARIFL